MGAPELLASPAADGVLPMPIPVVPAPVVPGLIAPPLFVPLAAGAPELEPPPAEPPELCAIAKVLVSASAPANAIVDSFMAVSSLGFYPRVMTTLALCSGYAAADDFHHSSAAPLDSLK